MVYCLFINYMNIDNLINSINNIEFSEISSPLDYDEKVIAFHICGKVLDFNKTEEFTLLGNVYYNKDDDTFIHSESKVIGFINNTLRKDVLFLDEFTATHTVRRISQEFINNKDHPFISNSDTQIIMYDIKNDNINRLIKNPE